MLQQLAVDPDIGHIEATHRLPVAGGEFCDKVSWRTLDLEAVDSIEQNLRHWLDTLDRLDCLICTAGILHDGELMPEKRLPQLQSADMHRIFQINAAGPLALLAGLEPLLKRAQRPKVFFLSAQVGSIEDNDLGGWYSYRMSKAALNMGLKTAAIEAGRWRNDAVVMAVHPGTTRTRLSAPFIRNRKQRVRSARETATQLCALLKRADAEHHGGFYTAAGKRLPW
jgi:NAD(P)-dependent dehydrogenase (short-subunit alcohol dehydrogenase family)